jgi:hypothetical protein
VEIAMGVLFAVGAVFNLSYTLQHGQEFYGSFAEGAWLSPSRPIIGRIAANARVFTVLLIAFQLTVAIGILTRGAFVVPSLVVGGVFAVVVAFFSSPGGAVGNLALAVVQIWLAATR